MKKFIFGFGVWTSVLSLIALGSVKMTGVDSGLAQMIRDYAFDLVVINTAIMTALQGYPSVPDVKLPDGLKRAFVLAFVACSAFFLIDQAHAADVNSAAPSTFKIPALAPQAPCTLSNCSGAYVGMGLSGSGTNANVIGNGIQGSVFSAGGDIDVHAGYQFWNGTFFAAGEVGIGNAFQPNQLVSALGAKTLTGYEVIKLGGALGGLLSQPTGTPTPGQAPAAINIPASIASVLMSPYFVTGAMQRNGISQWITGAGAEFLLASHWNLDLRYVYGAPVVAVNVLNSAPPLNLVTLGVNYHF